MQERKKTIVIMGHSNGQEKSEKLDREGDGHRKHGGTDVKEHCFNF